MEIRIPHQVVYETPDAVPVADVIESLRGVQQLFDQMPPLLEGCFRGLTIERIELSVQQISQESPLKEIFWAAIFFTFQKDLEKEVPDFLEKLGAPVAVHDYDTLVTVIFCLMLFYGVDLLYRHAVKIGGDSKIRRHLDGLVTEVAQRCGVSEDRIRMLLEERYGKGRVRQLMGSAIRVFHPSRRQKNSGMLVGHRRIEPEVVAEIPNDLKLLEAESHDTTDEYTNVEIELHAQDVDRAKQGWAAVIPEVGPNRMRLQLYPPINPEDIYTKKHIRGDVLIVSRPSDEGTMEPYLAHLVRLQED
ncbi:MAG: hypothetical protein L0210_07780 [Rhodospirillales bacterium]|nr:hypothetical protein [Rhodospirillales bacterium]